jgi:thiamine pyrophosphokinase
VVVLSGGDPLGPEVPAAAVLIPGSYVVAADSGIEHALAQGWPIDLAVGDFDSVDPDALARVAADGVIIDRHPTAKDATDLELALAAGAARRPDELVVVGGAGGRLDHLIGGLLALTNDALAEIRVSALVGPARVFVVRDLVELEADLGALVTLVPIGGPARGITTHGLRYPLLDEDLLTASTRGVSNEVVDRRVTVTVTAGVLLAILPGPLPEPVTTASSTASLR